jgi:hypothetical protein
VASLIEHIETFHLLAEIAIAIAGFAGVASVFGGREKQYREAELLRIRGLFELSALVLIGCFGISVVQALGIPKQQAISLVSLILTVAYGIVVLDVPMKATKLYRKRESTVTVAALVTAFSVYVIGLPLLLANTLVLRQEWPLILVMSLSILQSIWSFYRLVTREN